MSWTEEELYMQSEEEILGRQLDAALRNDPQTLEWEAEERARAKAKAQREALKAKAYAEAQKRCTLQKGSDTVSFWTVEGYCPYTLTGGKQQFFKTVETMRKRYMMLLNQGYSLVK